MGEVVQISAPVQKIIDDIDTAPPPLVVTFLLNRHPLLGGDYYRAYRAGALASARFGWHTTLADKMGKSETNPEGRLGFVTPVEMMGMPVEMARVFFPDVIVIRPVEKWTLEDTLQAQANGQKVIADVDDDLWGHEDLLAAGTTLTEEGSTYDTWFGEVDAVLCSTRHLARKVRDFGYRARVFYAPNCYDPTVLNAEPKPSRRLGTRLWLSGRSDAELTMYDEWVYPLLDRLDLSFTHIGADEPEVDELPAQSGVKARRRFGWDTPRLIERPSMVIPELAKEFARFSIGTIMMVDNEYNRSKTDTSAVELGLAGLPLVAASTHELYRNIPGVVSPTARDVEKRVRELLNPETWAIESKRVKTWARQRAMACESKYLESLLAAVNYVTVGSST
jgi:hypothetical protein